MLVLGALALSAASVPGPSAAMFIEVGSPTAWDAAISTADITPVGPIPAGFESQFEPGTPIKVARIRLDERFELRFDPLVHLTRPGVVRFVYLGSTTTAPTTFFSPKGRTFDNDVSSIGDRTAPILLPEGPVNFGFLSFFPSIDELDFIDNASGVTGDSGSVSFAATVPFELKEADGYAAGTQATMIIWDPGDFGPVLGFRAMYVGMVQVAPVPTPATSGLLGAAILVLAARTRRRRGPQV